MLEPGGHRPSNLAQAPKFLIGSIVISLSRCCFPNDEGPAPQIFFVEPPLHFWSVCHDEKSSNGHKKLYVRSQ